MTRYLRDVAAALSILSIAAMPIATAHAQDGWTDSGVAVHLTEISNRVGVGTIDPRAKLHVIGTVRVDGTVSTSILSSRPNTDLSLRLNGVEALRLEPTAGTPNVIGGAGINGTTEGVEGATIGGGG